MIGRYILHTGGYNEGLATIEKNWTSHSAQKMQKHIHYFQENIFGEISTSTNFKPTLLV
jgi:hypothetical protein